MIKELLVSFKENINTKTTNPFFGTLILVWLTKNWNLVYSIFNFDKGITLADKKVFIISHFESKPFVETLLGCILEAFIVLLVSFILVNLSRLIINFFEKRITPLVYKWTDEKSIVLKTVYDISEDERKRLEKRVEEEREGKLKLQEDYDKLEKRLAEIISNQNTPKVAKQKEDPIETSSSKILKYKSEGKATLIMKKFQEEGKYSFFDDISSAILNKKPIKKDDKLIEEFVSLGLITQSNYSHPGYYYYILTPLGSELYDNIIMSKLK